MLDVIFADGSIKVCLMVYATVKASYANDDSNFGSANNGAAGGSLFLRHANSRD